MPNNEITKLLQGVKDGRISVDDALLELKKQPFKDINFAKIDFHRKLRQGAAEVIYGAGKTAEQISKITVTMLQAGQKTILITRLDEKKAEAVKKEIERHPGSSCRGNGRDAFFCVSEGEKTGTSCENYGLT